MRAINQLSAFVLAVTPTSLAAYNLVQQFSGANFFTGWDFFNGFDNTTNGDVNYLSQANATADQLAFVNDAGQAIIKIDNTSFVPFNIKRNSVRINTHDFFSVGSVFVLDAAHLPFGCSVWPSFWTKGPNWPAGGEIDIMESVNLQTNNQMTLHTSPGCTQPANVQQLGSPSGSTDCSSGVDSSDGCTVLETQPNSFGAGFAAAGGGVWATQFDVSGIFIWFWSRPNVPASVTGATSSIDPSTWGTPSAAWPASSCNISNFFTPQQLVIDITLCGDFAGQPNVYQSTCGGPLGNSTVSICYIDNVINNGSNYTDAFFEINSVKVFSLDSPLDPSVSGSSTILSSASSAPTSGGNAEMTGNGAGTAVTGSSALYAAVLGAAILSGLTWVML